MESLRNLLRDLTGIHGVNAAIAVSRDGFILDAIANSGVDVEAIGAIVSTGVSSIESIGRELQIGAGTQSLLEFEGGIVMVGMVGDMAMLAVRANDRTNLGHLRIQVKKIAVQLEELL